MMSISNISQKPKKRIIDYRVILTRKPLFSICIMVAGALVIEFLADLAYEFIAHIWK